MAGTFAEKFERALAERREQEPGYGLRTLARALAKDDPDAVETIRRRLHKYRPPKGGGAAEVKPTPPTRHEIEDAMGLERDALAPDSSLVTSAAIDADFLADLAPLRRLFEIGRQLERGELQVVKTKELA